MRTQWSLLGIVSSLVVAAPAWAEPIAPAGGGEPSSAPATEGAAPAAPVDRPASSVAPEKEERSAKNSIYGELLGPALLYSINYERNIGDFSGRIGIGYLSLSASAPETDGNGNVHTASASAEFISVPLTVSYLGIGGRNNMLELGAGATILHMGAGASSFYASSSASTTVVLGVVQAGYRYQPADGGFLFRVGLSPIVSEYGAIPLPYLSLGGTF
jgi:hypothetical protein